MNTTQPDVYLPDKLTIAGHANGHALLKATVLASVAIVADNCTLLTLRTRSVLNLLVDRASEEALKADGWLLGRQERCGDE